MRIPFLAFACGLAVVAHPLHAEPEPAAKAALEQMAEAVAKAKAISYHIEAKGVGGVFEMLPVTKAEVIAVRGDTPGTWKMRVSGRATAAGMEPTEVTYVCDGARHTWIDYPNKRVLERGGTDQLPVGQAVMTASVRELFEAQPFSKERQMPTMKMEPQADLDGVKCDVIFLDPGPEQTKTRYYIATTDRLPRRIEMIIQGAGIDGKRVSDLTRVKIDTEPPPGAFAISTPDGFTFNSVFVPNTPTATATAVPQRERPVGPNVGELAPDFTHNSAGGDKVQLYSLRGNVVVVDFFGTWNLSSKRTTAEVEKIAKQYKDKPVKVFGLAVREASDAAVTKFFKDNNLTYPVLLKADESAKAYRVKKYPTLFVIGKDGEVVYTISSYDEKSYKEITDAIDRALEGPVKPAAAEGAETPRSKAAPPTKGGSDAETDGADR